MRKLTHIPSVKILIYSAIVGVVMLLGSCTNVGQPSTQSTAKKIEPHVSNCPDFVEIVKIRDCEYARGTYNWGSPLTHLGDCHNPIHQLKQQ